jgi:Zn-dependent oligopeptidase
MEIEYSNEVKGLVFAYRFDKWEQAQIASALKPVIEKLEKKIVKIENHPKNEGQVTYTDQIHNLRYEIKALQEIITTFES